MQEAYQRIRTWLLRGELAPGDRLVNRSLGTTLGVSTVTVREALHRLSSEGLVDYVPNAGAFVRAPSHAELQQLYDLRNCLDRFAVAELTGRVEISALHDLHDACTRMFTACRGARAASEDRLNGDHLLAWSDARVAFHATLLSATRNSWLQRAREPLDLVDRMVRSRLPEVPIVEAVATWRRQRHLIRALRHGDRERAEALMRERAAEDFRWALRASETLRPDERRQERFGSHPASPRASDPHPSSSSHPGAGRESEANGIADA